MPEQFDPVAASAAGAIRATRSGLQDFQSEAGAPEAPNQAQAFDTFLTGIQQVSQVSPFNILARGGAPVPEAPGLAGAEALPTPGELPALSALFPPLPTSQGQLGDLGGAGRAQGSAPGDTEDTPAAGGGASGNVK